MLGVWGCGGGAVAGGGGWGGVGWVDLNRTIGCVKRWLVSGHLRNVDHTDVVEIKRYRSTVISVSVLPPCYRSST